VAELAFHRALYRPGTLVDVGAHDGAFTLPFAALPGATVHAFEPLPQAFARLRAAVGDTPNVTLHAAALGDHEGEITLRLPVLDGVAQEQWGSITKAYAGLDARVVEATHTVPLRTLDSLALRDVTAIKLDAEGAEYEVLRGARDTLARCRPILSLELEERHREGATHAVPAFLDALGFDTWWEFYGAWHPLAAFDRATMHRASPNPAEFAVSDPYVFTFYALPREHAAAMLATLTASR